MGDKGVCNAPGEHSLLEKGASERGYLPMKHGKICRAERRDVYFGDLALGMVIIFSDPCPETQIHLMYIDAHVDHDNPVILMKGDHWLASGRNQH